MTQDSSLQTLREKIDHIDRQMVSLLKQRMDIVHEVGAVKGNQGNGSFLRPAREANMVRQLVNELKDVYPAQAVYNLWRNIISASLHCEKPLAIATHIDDAYAKELANHYFGGFIPLTQTHNLHDLLSFASANPSHIAVTATQASWWGDLHKHPHLRVFAALPFVDTTDQPYPPMVALSQATPEETGDDISLLVIRCNHDCTVNDIEQVFRTSNYKIAYSIANHHDYLIAIKGFYAPSSQLTLDSLNLTDPEKLIKSVYSAGCYATPICV